MTYVNIVLSLTHYAHAESAIAEPIFTPNTRNVDNNYARRRLSDFNELSESSQLNQRTTYDNFSCLVAIYNFATAISLRRPFAEGSLRSYAIAGYLS